MSGAFYVIEVGLPGKPKCPDEPEDPGPNLTTPATLICPKSKMLIVQIGAKAVYVQFGIMDQGAGSFGGSVDWQRPRAWTPTSFALPRNFDAVRVYNFTPGEEGQVTVEAV